jgi:hypothetical protein
MTQLVYITVYGDYLDYFKTCLEGLKNCQVDIALMTDQDFQDDRVKVYKVETPPDVIHICQSRVGFQKYIDINDYDRVWYMDADFLIFEDIFTKYADEETVWLNAEPLQTLGDETFGRYFDKDLSPLERHTYPKGDTISGGIYSVPKKYFNFFSYLDLAVQAAWVRWKDMWGVEQMVLNSTYLRYQESWPMKLIDPKDIGFLCPRRGGVTGNEMVVHCTLYQHQMKEIWQAYINS